MKNPMLARDTKEIIKIAESIGYEEKPSNGGSHRIFKCSGRPTISIPNHHDLAPGTRRQISKLILGNEYYSIK